MLWQRCYGLAKAEDIVGMRIVSEVHPAVDSAITLEMMHAICGTMDGKFAMLNLRKSMSMGKDVTTSTGVSSALLKNGFVSSAWGDADFRTSPNLREGTDGKPAIDWKIGASTG